MYCQATDICYNIFIKSYLVSKFWKKLIPREQPNQNKDMKIANSAVLGPFMRK